MTWYRFILCIFIMRWHFHRCVFVIRIPYFECSAVFSVDGYSHPNTVFSVLCITSLSYLIGTIFSVLNIFFFHILICGYRTLSTVYYFLHRQGRPVTLYRCIISKSYLIGTVFEYRILSTVYYSLSTGETCDVVPVHTLPFCYKMALQSTCFGI